MGRVVLFGIVSLLVGLFIYAVSWWLYLGSFFWEPLQNIWLCWFIVGSIFCTLFFFFWSLDLFLWRNKDKRPEKAMHDPIKNAKALVVLVAYNEEASVTKVVSDFKKQKDVSRVIVSDNNSKDKTNALAKKAGAIVVVEKTPGYGSACMAGLKHAAKIAKPNEVVVLCECDHTYFAEDIPKFLAYIENADMVLGTRLVPELVDKHTQLNYFFEFGNYFVAKLIHVKYYLRLTDVGCSYKGLRRDALRKLIPNLTDIGHSFSPHMIQQGAELGFTIVEIPVAFQKRWGESKGANGNLWLGFTTGMRMIFDTLFS